MPTALEELRSALNNLNNQDTPLESIKDVFNEILDRVESENVNGGSQPDPSTLARGIYDASLAATDVAANTRTPLSFGALLHDEAVIDLTNPILPTIVESGVYAITAVVNLTEGAVVSHQIRIELEFDPDGEDVDAPSFFWANAGVGFYGTVANTYFIAAGTSLQLTAIHFDSVHHGFGTNVTIQRVA